MSTTTTTTGLRAWHPRSVDEPSQKTGQSLKLPDRLRKAAEAAGAPTLVSGRTLSFGISRDQFPFPRETMSTLFDNSEVTVGANTATVDAGVCRLVFVFAPDQPDVSVFLTPAVKRIGSVVVDESTGDVRITFRYFRMKRPLTNISPLVTVTATVTDTTKPEAPPNVSQLRVAMFPKVTNNRSHVGRPPRPRRTRGDGDDGGESAPRRRRQQRAASATSVAEFAPHPTTGVDVTDAAHILTDMIKPPSPLEPLSHPPTMSEETTDALFESLFQLSGLASNVADGLAIAANNGETFASLAMPPPLEPQPQPQSSVMPAETADALFKSLWSTTLGGNDDGSGRDMDTANDDDDDVEYDNPFLT